MLIGQYSATIGAKNRIAFPKKFRDELGDNLIITQGFEGSLIVVSEEGWRSLLEGTEGMPLTDLATRETQRFLLGTAAGLELDEKGRFILPAHLKKYANLGNEIVFLGISRYVEIWDKKKWEEHNNELINTISGVADKLSGKESG
ncbi:MAG: division/cell wall cluster transcriptional repressor MraZ [Candidatus Levybacteria bacterium]|nr:division/cell wall cluster transcriptional repressor MraZ [Candidatus Levybacteria bacterium]